MQIADIRTHLSSVHRVADALHTPVVGGENRFIHHDSRAFFSSRKLPVLQPDVMRGGHTELRVIARHAHAAGLTIAPHMFPELMTHLVASIENPSWLEYVGWYDHSWVEPLIPREGHLAPPTGPGVGLTLKRELFKDFPYSDRL